MPVLQFEAKRCTGARVGTQEQVSLPDPSFPAPVFLRSAPSFPLRPAPAPSMILANVHSCACCRVPVAVVVQPSFSESCWACCRSTLAPRKRGFQRDCGGLFDGFIRAELRLGPLARACARHTRAISQPERAPPPPASAPHVEGSTVGRRAVNLCPLDAAASKRIASIR